ncbi:MAG: type II toxin-antitoxin system RelB/DinJ family antitoxin [Verrucomicrobia bacterium]|nr:type II toxin-antitoxin system RelB/DinJ family antitoxin [Verrucomicrobiota bacterium]
MAKTAMIRARIEPSLKASVERLFHRLGLTATQAIELFYRRVRLQKGLPFEVKIPNAATRKAFEETDRAEGLVRCRDADDMFKKLGI